MLITLSKLLVLILLSFYLASCMDYKDPDIQPVLLPPVQEESHIIGLNGGKVTKENAFVQVPAQTFDDDHNISITTLDNTTFDKSQTLREYALKGLPEDFSKPITIAVKQLHPEDNLILLKMEVFVKSLNTTEVRYKIVQGVVKDGYITYVLEPNTATKTTSSKNRSIGKYFDIGWAALQGYKTLDTAKGHFRIHFPDVYVNEALDIEEILEDAYAYFTKLGFDLKRRTSWPMTINIKSFGGSDKNKFALYNQSKRGAFSDNYSYIDFNTQYINESEDGLKATTIHEFFHFVQSLYYPTTLGIKHGNASLWFDEACSVWVEGAYVSGYRSELVDQRTLYYPFKKFENTQDYGYGMSGMIKKLVDTKGSGILSDIYTRYYNGSLDITNYVNSAFPILFWNRFIRAYIEGEIYDDLAPVQLTLPYKTVNLEKDLHYQKDISLADWESKLLYFPFPKTFDGKSDTKLLLEIKGETTDASVIAFSLQRDKTILKLGDTGKKITIEDITTLFKQRSYGILVVITNAHIQAPFDHQKKLSLDIKAVTPLKNCPKIYDVNPFADTYTLHLEDTQGDGFDCQYYASTHIRSEIPLIKSTIPDGVAKFYYDSGELKEEIPFVNGSKEGIQKEYSDQGVLYHETAYVAGKQNGVEKKYNRLSGQLEQETPYIDGKKNGVEKYYNELQNVIREIPYQNGLKEGISRSYTGNPASPVIYEKMPYVRGVKQGVAIIYNSNGTIFMETPYVNDREHGVQKKYWRDTGTIGQESNWVNGDKVGKETNYYPTGEISNVAIYTSFMRVREETGYYLSGQEKYKWYFDENGQYHGLQKWWHENGQLSTETPYVHGDQKGTGKSYDENGKLVGCTIFFGGGRTQNCMPK